MAGGDSKKGKPDAFDSGPLNLPSLLDELEARIARIAGEDSSPVPCDIWQGTKELRQWLVSKASAAEQAEPGWTVTQWGLPDWTVPESYGDMSHWCSRRWRWEFLRRRDNVREFFDTFANETYAENMAYHVLPKGSPGRPARFLEPWVAPDEPGYRVLCLPEERKSLGLHSVPNPRIGRQAHYSFVIDPVLTHQHGDMVHPDGIERGLTMEPGQAGIVFCLDLPLAPQLETARRSLEYWQREIHGNLVLSRSHKTKWPLYLRALDAREAGASWAEMTEQFFAEGLLHRRAAPEGGYCAPPPHAARDIWEQARRVALRS